MSRRATGRPDPSHPLHSRTRIKICGLTREADVDAAVEAGADAVGFVFYEKSPRYVGIERAAQLARGLPPFVTPVGLFVNADPALIESAAAAIPGLLLQFHGDETPAQCRRPGRPYLRAVRMAPGVDLLDFAQRFDDAMACCSTPSSTALAVAERFSIGLRYRAACPVRSFCLVGCMPQM